MIDDNGDRPQSELLAAHEAGHAVMATVFGVRFDGVAIRDVHPFGQLQGLHGADLTGLSSMRIAFAGAAAEHLVLGKYDLSHMRKDWEIIQDESLYELALERAAELLSKYRAALDALHARIMSAADIGFVGMILMPELVELAAANGASFGVERDG